MKLIWVEKSKLSENIGIKAHTHDYYHLYYIIEGECFFTVQNASYSVADNEMIIAAPSAVHGFQVNRNTKMLEIKFSADSAELANDLSALSFPIQADTHADYLIDFIVNHGRSRLQYFIDSAHQYLGTLLIHLTQSLHDSDNCLTKLAIDRHNRFFKGDYQYHYIY